MKMKDKKSTQAAERYKRKSDYLKRKKEPSFERIEPILVEKPTILIVCEGVNTEPSYFNGYRLTTAVIKPVGIGYNTVSLVEKALELSNEEEYEQVWCVFDKDSFKKSDFNAAITNASKYGFHVAYSNQAFEYWLILHLEDHQGGGMHRRDYGKKINSYIEKFGISFDHEGSKNITEDFFDFLSSIDFKTKKSRRDLAIKRAKRNHLQLEHLNPADQESVTTVYKLVEMLLKYL